MRSALLPFLILYLQTFMVILWYTVIPTASTWLIFLPAIIGLVYLAFVVGVVTISIETFISKGR